MAAPGRATMTLVLALMRAAAIERHRIVWRTFEGARPEAWPAHMRVIAAVYGW